MKKLSLIGGFLLLFASVGLWSQTSWESPSEMTTSQLLNDSLSLSGRLVDLSEMSFQDYLALRDDSTALETQLVIFSDYNGSLERQVTELKHEVTRLETVAQKAELSQTASTELTASLQSDLKKLKRNNTLIIIGGSVIVTGLLVGLGYALFGG